MAGTEINTRRQKQLAERIESILIAASRLFADKGFHRTTTREIAEAADVAEGTLYNYFENKNELLFAILTKLVEDQHLEAQLIESSTHDPRRFFSAILKSRTLASKDNTLMHQAILSEILADSDLRHRYYAQLLEPNLVLLENHLRDRILLNQLRSVNIPLAARYITSLWIGLFVLQVLDDPLLEKDRDEFARQCTDILFDGIGLVRGSNA